MVAAVVLAAGASTRFGSPKQRLLLPDVLERIGAAVSIGEIVVVIGAYEADTGGHRLVHCANWKVGPGASLRCGLASLGAEVEAAIVVLADGPDLATEAVERVIAAWQATNAPLVAACYAGVRGHPLLIARPGWDGIPNEGLRRHLPLLVPCDDLGSPGDVDKQSDLPGRFRNRPGEPMHDR